MTIDQPEVDDYRRRLARYLREGMPADLAAEAAAEGKSYEDARDDAFAHNDKLFLFETELRAWRAGTGPKPTPPEVPFGLSGEDMPPDPDVDFIPPGIAALVGKSVIVEGEDQVPTGFTAIPALHARSHRLAEEAARDDHLDDDGGDAA